MRSCLFACLTALALLSAPRALQAQTSSIAGTVLDSSRAPIVAAHVTATPVGGGATVSAVTDARGQFTLAVAGDATVTVSAPGFKDASERLRPNASGHEFVLQVAGIREDVAVTGSTGYAVANTSSATRTLTPLRDVPQAVTVVTHDLIRDQLMLSIADVVRYVPGITTHQGEKQPRSDHRARQQFVGRLLHRRRPG